MEAKTTMKRQLTGVVVSNKMEKTIVVRVDRTIQHPKYGKRYTVSKRYKTHVEGEKPEVGAKVTIQETRPLSKDKRFRLVK
ncbi:MAG: 30S ribosomal protein S17 [Patescibacteria group bacterium]